MIITLTIIFISLNTLKIGQFHNMNLIMGIKWQLILTVLVFSLSPTVCKKNIYVAGLLPLHPLLIRSISLAELAVEEINANPAILPDYDIVIEWKDSNCDTAVAFNSFTQFMQQDNVTYVSLFGLPCLAPTSAIADILSVYNTMLLTFSTYTPDFYTLYYSSTPTYVVGGFPIGLTAIPAQLKFITDHKWTRLAIVNFESEYFTDLGYELQKALYKLGIENSAETISIPITDEEYYQQIDYVIDTIRSENYRIIIFNTYHWTVSDIFCRIANRSLNFKEYTFILPGSFIFSSYDTYWINGTCNLSDLLQLVSGSIGFTHYPRIQDFLEFNYTTISGLTPHEIIRDYDLRNFTVVPEIWSTFAPYMYDSMWALAIGLHETVLQGYEPANLTKNDRANFTKSLYEHVVNVTFESLTGEVAFIGSSRISREVQLIEYTNDSFEFRGLYINLPYELSHLDNLSEVKLINSIKFKYWNSSRSDGVEVHYSLLFTFIFMSLLSILTAIYITVYIIIILYGVYNKFPAAIHSEPSMSVFILVSNYFWLAFSVLLNVDGKFTTFTAPPRVCSIYCHLLVWLGFVSMSLILGGVLAKAVKLYALWVLNKFQRKSRNKLRFRYLVLLPLSLTLIDSLIILVSYGLEPILYQSWEVLSGVTNPPIYRISFCDFKLSAFLTLLIVIKVVLVFICLFLAYHLRNVTHKSQRYSFIIGLIMYNTVFFAILIIFVLSFVSDYDIKIALASLFGILSSFITSTITGLPIVFYMIKDPTGENLFEAKNVDTFPEDNTLLRRRIDALERDLEKVTSMNESSGDANSPTKYSFLNEAQDEFALSKSSQM